MNEDFVPFELAVKLKEKGFKEQCIAYYWEKINEHTPSFLVEDNMPEDGLNILDLLSNHNRAEWSPFIDAPTISQVLKWLREEKNIFIVIAANPTLSTKDKIAYYYQVYSNSNGVTSDYYESEECYTQWEDCAIDSIKYVLDNLI
ncbi:MAG: hypothetical protein IKV17_07730 [Bacteroidaceae bacterium]|nr:hypothetical protein [Bacteroidaceae bacterium]